VSPKKGVAAQKPGTTIYPGMQMWAVGIFEARFGRPKTRKCQATIFHPA